MSEHYYSVESGGIRIDLAWNDDHEDHPRATVPEVLRAAAETLMKVAPRPDWSGGNVPVPPQQRIDPWGLPPKVTLDMSAFVCVRGAHPMGTVHVRGDGFEWAGLATGCESRPVPASEPPEGDVGPLVYSNVPVMATEGDAQCVHPGCYGVPHSVLAPHLRQDGAQFWANAPFAEPSTELADLVDAAMQSENRPPEDDVWVRRDAQ